jgi:hypothetical protein
MLRTLVIYERKREKEESLSTTLLVILMPGVIAGVHVEHKTKKKPNVIDYGQTVKRGPVTKISYTASMEKN